jgi:hypothetical protein
MSEGAGGPGKYVRRVREQNRRYAQDLLEENGKLRALVASYQVEETRLREELAQAQTAAARADELKAQLDAAEEERRHLEEHLHAARKAVEQHEREQERLRAQLGHIDDDNRRYSDEFVALEQQNNNLANLYVASYRLHGTLDRDEVIESLQEIIANLIGSEEMAVFEVDRAHGVLRLVASNGVQPEVYEAIPLGRGLIGRAAQSGERVLVGKDDGAREPGEEHVTALIPLGLNGEVFGLLAIFRLLPQKAHFEEVDFEIFDLLGSQAGVALYATGLHERASAG